MNKITDHYMKLKYIWLRMLSNTKKILFLEILELSGSIQIDFPYIYLVIFFV